MSNRNLRALPLLLALGLTLTACASGGGPGGNPFSQDPGERGEIEIKIVNMNFSDATVWALISGGRRQRLGFVTGKSEKIFTVPWTHSEPLSVEFDLVAGPRCLSESLVVDPGDLLELQIASNAATDPSCR